MSEIRATTISDAAGTGPITLTGQSAAKAWCNFNGTGTIATRDSVNVSSLTDSTTGEYSVNVSNAFDAANYAFYGSASKAAGAVSSTNSAILYLKEAGVPTTSAVAIGVCDSTGTAKDFDTVVVCTHGDLA